MMEEIEEYDNLAIQEADLEEVKDSKKAWLEPREKPVEQVVEKIFEKADLDGLEEDEKNEEIGLEDEEDIQDMKNIREVRNLQALQEREEKKNDAITIAYRAANKEQRARSKKDAEIAMNHLSADQMIKKSQGALADFHEELEMDGKFMEQEPADAYSGEESDDFGSESDGGSESGEAGSAEHTSRSKKSGNSAEEAPASEDYEARSEENGEIPRDSLMQNFHN